MTRILIVDEVRLACRLMADVLAEEDDLEVIGCAATEAEAMDLIDQADLMLVSTDLPNEGATRLTQQALGQKPEIYVLVMGIVDAPHMILHYIEAGATGYVLREDSVDELLENIRTTARGQALASPNIISLLMSRVSELTNLCADKGFDFSKPFDLTPREMEILHLLGDELSNQEIADQLFIASGTVKNHVHSILRKLDAKDRTEAVAYLYALQKRKSYRQRFGNNDLSGQKTLE